MVEQDLLVHGIGKKQLLLESVANLLFAVVADHLHPLHECLPLAEQPEELVVADLVERTDLLQPISHSDELDGFGVYELSHALTAEGVVVPDIVRLDLVVGDHLHVVVIVRLFPHQIYKLFRRELLLSDHPEKHSQLAVRSETLQILLVLFYCRSDQLDPIVGVFATVLRLFTRLFNLLLLAFCSETVTAKSLPRRQLGADFPPGSIHNSRGVGIAGINIAFIEK